MAETRGYKVLRSFRDKYTKDVYIKNEIVEFTRERATEIVGSLGDVIELAEETADDIAEELQQETECNVNDAKRTEYEKLTVDDLKEELDALKVEYKAKDTKDTLIDLLINAE